MILVYVGIQKSQHLEKVGVSGKAVVIYENNVEITQPIYNRNSYIPASYQTNIQYKLLNVPGYSTKTFSSTLASQYNKPAVFVGQSIDVIYDPNNPSDNDIKSNVSHSSFATIIFILMLLVIVLPVIIFIITIRQFNKRRKIRNNLMSGG